MKNKSLMQKSLTQFAFCVALLLLLSTPLFYWLTKNFYAEDMIDIVEAVSQGQPIPALDLEADILHGVVIQFALIVTIFGVAVVLTMRFISRRLWLPFDRTLRAIESFRLEEGTVPALPKSNIREFARLNAVLDKLMTNSLNSYRMQKEFTENASHELQTPLAVFQGKLDILLQQPGITESQAAIIQDLYQMNSRLSHLSRNLLLLAKMENSQFERSEDIDVVAVLSEQLPLLENLVGGISLRRDFRSGSLPVKANRVLLESLTNNLVVNAVRHNRPDGEVTVAVVGRTLVVSNTADGPALNANLIFNRFYRPAGQTKGNGLGLAIVKAVCDYHGWAVAYSYRFSASGANHSGMHEFCVNFGGTS